RPASCYLKPAESESSPSGPIIKGLTLPPRLGCFVLDPGDLRDQLIDRGKRDRRIGGEPRAGVGGERCQRGIADQEDVEVARKVLVARRGAAETHVGAVAGQEYVPDLLLPKEFLERLVSLGVVNDHIFRMQVDVFGH